MHVKIGYTIKISNYRSVPLPTQTKWGKLVNKANVHMLSLSGWGNKNYIVQIQKNIFPPDIKIYFTQIDLLPNTLASHEPLELD